MPLPFNEEAAAVPSISQPPAGRTGSFLKIYFFLFVAFALAQQVYYLAVGESYFWKFGEGTVRIVSAPSDPATASGPLLLVGAVVLASFTYALLTRVDQQRAG